MFKTLQKPPVSEAFVFMGNYREPEFGFGSKKGKLRLIFSLNNSAVKIMNRKYIYPIIILLVAALLLIADRCA